MYNAAGNQHLAQGYADQAFGFNGFDDGGFIPGGFGPTGWVWCVSEPRGGSIKAGV